jgi:peptide/nickel transport system permease protein
MGMYILKRVMQLIPTLFLVSICAFVIISLPPGDYVDQFIAYAGQSNLLTYDEETIANLKIRYGLDKPLYVQYFKWISTLLQGDLGYSFAYGASVNKLIGSRIGLTFLIAFSSLLFTWVVAFPIGLYSATRQYSIGDYAMTIVGFIGLATPNFFLALILMWIGYSVFGFNVGGLFSIEYIEAPWSIGKFLDLLKHLWIPVVVVGTASTAGLIRVFRANLLDELRKPYVDAARAKGLKEGRVVLKYPVRIALIPFISTVGWALPRLVSGATITAVVLSLPTTGPMLLRALRTQDMFLAGSFIMILSVLTVIGTFISDILLAWLDPRIRYT